MNPGIQLVQSPGRAAIVRCTQGASHKQHCYGSASFNAIGHNRESSNGRQSRPAAYESSQIVEAREPSSQKPSATRRQLTQPPEETRALPQQ